MKRQLTFEQYRGIDLALFAGILIVFEFLIISAATKWFPEQPFTVSAVGAVTAIVMMRWKAFGAVHAVLGGLIFCVMSGASAQHYLIYCGGNLLALLALLMIRALGSERIRTQTMLSMIFALGVQALMQIGRGAVSLVLGHTAGEALAFITTDALSLLFTLVIIWVARHMDGLFEDQKIYLLRLQKEREKERGE